MTPASAHLARANASQGLAFTPEQSQMIRDSYANGASEDEFRVLLEVAKTKNLNPLLGQIAFVKRWDSKKNRDVWACQTTVDGFRAVAERTGLYAGQDEAEYETDKDGRPAVARVRVYRKDWHRPAVGVARWEEFVQTKKDGAPMALWGRAPFLMLGKCAETQAFRKAFPEETAGLGSIEAPTAGMETEVVDVETGEVIDSKERTAREFLGAIESVTTIEELTSIGVDIDRKRTMLSPARVDSLRKLYAEKLAQLKPPALPAQDLHGAGVAP